jgi:hypothetical protein
MGIGGFRFGAGRPAHRPAAEQYRRLDIRKMFSTNCIKPGNWFGWQWSNDAGESTASVSCAVNEYASYMTVSYGWWRYDQNEREEVSFAIGLTTTPCNFGGVRWWFRCPCCNRRAALLYISGRALRCTTCGRYSYASQRGDTISRAWIKQAKLEAKLIDGWQKPKRMRWKTFERLQAGIDECEQQKDFALMAAMERLGYA